MNIKKHLKFKKQISEDDEVIIEEIQSKINRASINPNRLDSFIAKILEIIHTGLDINNIKYLDEIFFDFYILRSNTEPHIIRIYDQIVNIGDFEENTQSEQTHLVNLYRNIVSDLFDPYINLIVATFQFNEGTFVDMQQTNLRAGERSKFEYSKSRLKNVTLLDGYNPIVRNAISHSGTEGIIYEANEITFRSIKRGDPPKIEYVTWTNQELLEKILQLMDFVLAIDNSIEIIGFDSSEIIKNNKDLYTKFIDEIISKDQRLMLQNSLESDINKIVSSTSINNRDKLGILSKILFSECKNRGLDINSINFNHEAKVVYIETPISQIDIDNDNEVIGRVLHLIRYGTIAIVLFKHKYLKFIITEKKDFMKDNITIEIGNEILQDYIQEEAGLYDILHDCKVFINNKKFELIVDFEKLKEIEYSSIRRRFPKKKR